ncbi:MAG: hypothetical protein LQ352_008238, partial [Teloschistes flavicans]
MLTRLSQTILTKASHRLGKTCTFSPIQHRGDQKIQKPSTNVAQRERSLDLLTQSWDSPSPKVTGDKEGLHSDERPPASALPADGNDDSEQRQPVLVDTIEKSADISPGFDMSFLAEFGQQINDPDGDKTCNLTLSPWPFFSTTLPSTQPEPIQLEAARASDIPLSPPLSAGDDLPHYLPPTRQSQDSPPFEIGSNTASTPLRASPFKSTVAGDSCHCLAAVIFAVEEFEASCNLGSRAELDSIIAHQKETIKRCHLMLKCSSCVAKRETLVLLVFLTEKIVAACGRIVGLYRIKDGDILGGSVPSSSLCCSPTDGLWYCVHMEDQGLAPSAFSPSSETDCTHLGSAISTRTSTSSDWQEVLLGDYEISSPLEWDHLVR